MLDTALNLITGVDPIASWWLAIIIIAVVTIVVAVMLLLIIRTAAGIEREVAVIWANGQRVANNTIHIATLYKTHEYVGGILGRAGRILAHAKAIRDHAKTCRVSCPQCILQKR